MVLKGDDSTKLIGYRLVNKNLKTTRLVIERIIRALYYREFLTGVDKEVYLLKMKLGTDFHHRMDELEAHIEVSQQFIDKVKALKKGLPEIQQ